jgi:hypothetical protein
MTERHPDFDELVGTDLEPSERARLLRVHGLLVSAGPPPDVPETLAAPEPLASVHALPHRRRFLVALAAALGVAFFAIGYLVGDRQDERGTFDEVTMSGTGSASGASATLEIFDLDEAGNWPMEMRVDGLEPSGSGKPYELWLTRDGELAALCGSFLAEPDGSTVVPMNAPYKLRDFDGWVVVEEDRETPLLTT